MTLDSTGNLYGTTSNFNAFNDGIVFRLDTSNTLAVLHNFTYLDGVNPPAGLIFDSAGNLYGTTYLGGPGGNGTIFKLDTSNHFTVLHSFSNSAADGANPGAGLAFDSAGNLYGTTVHGGTSNNCSGGCGTAFKLDTSNTLTVLHSFSSTDGAFPSTELTLDSAGNLYGATYNGGASGSCSGGCGTVFRLDTNNTLTVLYSFSNTDGANPDADFLIFDGAGNLYGTTFDGGTGGLGTVFKLAITYALTYTAGANGTIEGMSPQTVNNEGSGTAVTAVPNTGYHFVNWS